VFITPLCETRARASAFAWRIATKLLALAAGVRFNHDLGQPTRSFAALAA
jgi:hypothetical protein